jgi:hypothetical protein
MTAAPMTDTAPVFVFGALRSGTTMFRLMLDAHPHLFNPGETDFLFDHLKLDRNPPVYDLEALRGDRVFKARRLSLPDGLDGLALLADLLRQLDAKGPGLTTLNIHRHPDRVAAVLPGARIIHLVRDPRDVARSTVGMGWAGTLHHGVDHWIATEAAWDRAAPAFSPGQVLELRFEDLLADVEGGLRRVCAFLGVAFAPEMLGYDRASTYAPPDPKLAEQWRRKSTPREIAHVEAKAGDLMLRRGYALSGGPREPAGLAERAALALRNKAAVWGFGIARFGPALYFEEKATRLIGWRRRHRVLHLRMQEIATRHLK